MQERRIILFGGTFDPIHLGHLVVATYAREYLYAERVILIPAGRAPHKIQDPWADGTDRIEMIRLAISDSFGLEVSDCELRRSQPSYTLDTVRYFQDLYGPGVELYWLVGADLAKDLANWNRSCELIDSCRIAVMYRAGFARPDFSALAEWIGTDRTRKLQQYVVPTPLIDVSSSDIRNRIAQGEAVEDRVKPLVWQYISRKGLYRRANPEKGGSCRVFI